MRKSVIVVLSTVVVAGVVLAVGILPAATSPSPGPLFASLDGASEVGPDGKKRAGDPDGAGAFNAVIDGGQLCFGLSVRDIAAPTAAHIHRGNPSVAGPVVVPLTPPPSGDPGASSGCVTVDAALADEILAHRTRFYVNVHNAGFPGGAVRGQLFKKG